MEIKFTKAFGCGLFIFIDPVASDGTRTAAILLPFCAIQITRRPKAKAKEMSKSPPKLHLYKASGE